MTELVSSKHWSKDTHPSNHSLWLSKKVAIAAQSQNRKLGKSPNVCFWPEVNTERLIAPLPSLTTGSLNLAASWLSLKKKKKKNWAGLGRWQRACIAREPDPQCPHKRACLEPSAYMGGDGGDRLSQRVRWLTSLVKMLNSRFSMKSVSKSASAFQTGTHRSMHRLHPPRAHLIHMPKNKIIHTHKQIIWSRE